VRGKFFSKNIKIQRGKMRREAPKKGRRSKFSQPVHDQIIKAFACGASYSIAAQSGGISRSTLYEWMEKGRNQARGQYRTFLDRCEKALGDGAITNLQVIDTAAKKDWRAAAWKLERRFGYTRDNSTNSVIKETPIVLEDNAIDALKEQAKDLKAAAIQAKASQSWQAYAALQRQFLACMTQIRNIESEESTGDEMDGYTDDQLINEITNTIISLPPILRQRLEGNIRELDNVIKIGEK
jgi:hypothetical protein